MEKLNKNKIQIEIDLNKIRVFSIFILFLLSLFVFYYSLSLGQGTQRYTVFRTDNSGFMFKKSNNTFAPLYAKGVNLSQNGEIISEDLNSADFLNRIPTFDLIKNLTNIYSEPWFILGLPNNGNGFNTRFFNLTLLNVDNSTTNTIKKIILIGGNYYPVDQNLRWDPRGTPEGYYEINLSSFGISYCLTAMATPINLDQGSGRDITAQVVSCDRNKLGVYLTRPPRIDSATVHGFSWLVIAVKDTRY